MTWGIKITQRRDQVKLIYLAEQDKGRKGKSSLTVKVSEETERNVFTGVRVH